MSERGFLRRPVQVTVSGLVALAGVALALGAAGALWWNGEGRPSANRGADTSSAGSVDQGAERGADQGTERSPGEGSGGARVGASAPAVETYEASIRPLLDAKCSRCHGAEKQKARLSLASMATILAGGKHGPAIDRAAPARSLILARVRLPVEDDDHMPPSDEEQLAPEELATLERWILAGSPSGDDSTVAAAPAVAAAAGGARSTPELPATPTAPEADPAALAALRDALVHAQPVSEGSPFLWIDFAAVAPSIDDARARELLAPLSKTVRELSLARTAVGDDTLALLAGFPELRRLDVRATRIGDRGIAALATHDALAELVLSQNRLDDACVDDLIAMPALARVHAWKSGLSAAGLTRLRAARPRLAVDDGAASPSAALEVETQVTFTKTAPAPQPPLGAQPTATAQAPSAPVVTLAPVNTKCPVSGAPVKPEFAIVHEGRVIGFCCPECPKQFWADPAKFAGRIE